MNITQPEGCISVQLPEYMRSLIKKQPNHVYSLSEINAFYKLYINVKESHHPHDVADIPFTILTLIRHDRKGVIELDQNYQIEYHPCNTICMPRSKDDKFAEWFNEEISTVRTKPVYSIVIQMSTDPLSYMILSYANYDLSAMHITGDKIKRPWDRQSLSQWLDLEHKSLRSLSASEAVVLDVLPKVPHLMILPTVEEFWKKAFPNEKNGWCNTM